MRLIIYLHTYLSIYTLGFSPLSSVCYTSVETCLFAQTTLIFMGKGSNMTLLPYILSRTEVRLDIINLKIKLHNSNSFLVESRIVHSLCK